MPGDKLLCSLVAILHHVIQQGSLTQTLKNTQLFSENLSSWEFRRKIGFEESQAFAVLGKAFRIAAQE